VSSKQMAMAEAISNLNDEVDKRDETISRLKKGIDQLKSENAILKEYMQAVEQHIFSDESNSVTFMKFQEIRQKLGLVRLL